ncbi:MAG TPA: imidazole glycerol phosphate synthase cyclase subunit [bacterium]|nr:imidazole glycerol phosphate synthase cyclase subunit [bacterium]HND77259.1 imidazole glycerol phosphate synthase cyclase subunit [bacterium]HNH32501.1 imidazole glycerol phosphate synthase cyclase subunit [bacterium]HNM13298.1 imidazole glycerol phosphate synthase cyclase subunit [bacterium]HNO90563.1 imidazole glycerol phosphate synthase cyclase subunit [bacterium]
MNKRIIARLDIKGPNLVKGIHLEGLRVLGDPSKFAHSYFHEGADELIYQDVVASLYDRNSLHSFIAKAAEQILIPLTVGGGIRTIEDIRTILRFGADKVSLNTGVLKRPELIREAANSFGSSTIVIAIEAIRQKDGKYYCYIDNGREFSGREVADWVCEVEALGAGEILLTSVDRDGTGLGFDIELVKMVSGLVNIPVIAHGGCGKIEDISEVFKVGNADAVAVASVLHYGMIGKEVRALHDITEGNFEFLKSNKSFSKITPLSMLEIKKQLIDLGYDIRN